MHEDSRVYFAQAEALWTRGSLELEIPATAQELSFYPADRQGVRRGRFLPGTAAILGPGIGMGLVLRLATGWDRSVFLMACAWSCLLRALAQVPQLTS